MKTRAIALCDCNSFYASCEKVFNPQVQHLPTVVLSNNDGNAIARCPLAKALGIEMGVPYHQLQHLIHQHQVQVFSSNFALSGDISARVMSILAEFTPEMEIYSIDESFLDLSDFARYDLRAYCHSIRTKVRTCTGIPVSIGVGSSKTLAKIANRIAKRTPEFDGIFDLTAVDPELVLA